MQNMPMPSSSQRLPQTRTKKMKAGRLVRGMSVCSLLGVAYYVYFLVLLGNRAGSYSTQNKKVKIESLKEFKGNVDQIAVKLEDKEIKMPSATNLLTSKPPFEDSDVIKLYPKDSKDQPLIQSPNTLVTGYFRVRGKYHAGKYDEWMENILSIQDAVVVFTEPDLVDQIKRLRSHAVNRTVIVPVGLDDLPIGQLFSTTFWDDQLQRDPEKRIHRSYQLFWVWLSKTWCVTQAIRMNFFDSDLFVWADIGSFRDRKWNSKTIVRYRENVPANEMLFLAHHKPDPPKEELFNDKYKHKNNFYHSGSSFVGYKDTWLTYHKYFLETIDRFLEKGMIIVEDQAVLQSVCLSRPEICAYVPFTQVADNKYFGIRYVLHHKKDFKYWRKEQAKS